MLLDNHDHGSKIMMFETLSIHDRKLWLQNMNDAVEKYRQNVEVEKTKNIQASYIFFYQKSWASSTKFGRQILNFEHS